MLVNANQNNYTAKIANCKNYQKQLFNITKNLMGNTAITTMPSNVCPVDMAQRMCARWTWRNVCVPGGHGATYVCPVDMAQRFGYHFIEKVLNTRKDIVACGEDRPYTTMAAMSNDAAFGGVPLVCFETVTESDVERLVASALVKSCELDPIPTWLLKQYSPEFVPLITAAINASLTTSNVPADFKHAIVKPL